MEALAKSFAQGIRNSPALFKIVRPVAERYVDLTGYRKIGLVYDDIIAEENPVVQKALKRLPPRLVYDRMFRQRRAMQCSLSHTLLPTNEQTKPEEDVPYLQPYIAEIEAEIAEREQLDALTKSK